MNAEDCIDFKIQSSCVKAKNILFDFKPIKTKFNALLSKGF